MAQLVIDIGNTRTKLAVFDGKNLVRLESKKHIEPSDLISYLDGEEFSHSIISSVNDEILSLEAVLRDRTNYVRFTSGVDLGISNQYKSKNTLGLDRLAALKGAKSLYPDANCLVIDAGSCITYDAIDINGTYFGGSISPGLNMRLKAMHQFTRRLPSVDLVEYDNWYGDDTTSSMLSGVLNGVLAEVRGFLELYHSKYKGLQVLLCGGDANFFDTRLKNSIFAHTLKTEPNLVLIGLNEVILYNDQDI